jgi:hypothetical protein
MAGAPAVERLIASKPAWHVSRPQALAAFCRQNKLHRTEIYANVCAKLPGQNLPVNVNFVVFFKNRIIQIQ